jgi:thioredoxin reductase
MARNDHLRVAVLGAGPIGLEAALYARSLGLPATIFERGRIGEHVQRWGHVRLFSPFGMNVTPLGRAAILGEKPKHTFPTDGDCITGREHVAAYLEPLAKAGPIAECLRTETQVLHVGRHDYLKDDYPGDARRGQEPFRLVIRQGKNREESVEADIVLDCTGTYGQHRWLGDGGIPAIGEQAAESFISYTLDDILGDRKGHYAGKNVLVIGAGYSAATTVTNLTTLAQENRETWTIWLARTSGTQPLRRIQNDPLKERDRLAMKANTLATRAEGNIEFHNQAVIDAIDCPGQDRGFKVTGRLNGKEKVWEVERVIANIGYVPDTRLYGELQVHECYATQGPINLAAALLKHGGADCLTIPSGGPQLLRNPEPNFFILGAKSYGRNSQFLLKTGFEQVRDVFSLIMGKAELDLYKKK